MPPNAQMATARSAVSVCRLNGKLQNGLSENELNPRAEQFKYLIIFLKLIFDYVAVALCLPDPASKKRPLSGGRRK